MNRARKEQMLEEQMIEEELKKDPLINEILTECVMNLGREMLNQNLSDSTKILDLITLGEFRQLLELAEEDPSMEITFEVEKD